MVATVFIDHFRCLSFVHLQSTLSSNDTLQAKKTFKRYNKSHGIKVIHYHADNGMFVDHPFIENIKLQNQKVIYCSVNVHFQNGVAEKCIWDFQDLTHTLQCSTQVLTGQMRSQTISGHVLSNV